MHKALRPLFLLGWFCLLSDLNAQRHDIQLIGPTNGRATAAQVAPDGALWLAFEGQGVSMRRGEYKQSWLLGQGLVYCLDILPNGRILAGAQDGLYLFDGESWEKQSLPTAEPVTAVTHDQSGRLWLATPTGLISGRWSEWTNHTSKASDWQKEPWPQPFKTRHILYSSNQFVFSTDDGVWYRSSAGVWTQDLPDHDLRAVATNGRLWFAAAEDGAWILKDAGWDRWNSQKASFSGGVVLSSGWIWAWGKAGLYGGLEGKSQAFTDKRGQPLEDIQVAVADHAGALWVVAREGIYRIPEPEGWFLSDALPLIENSHVYTTLVLDPHHSILATSDGLWERRGSEFLPMRSPSRGVVFSLDKSADGMVWAATEDGLYRWESGKWADASLQGLFLDVRIQGNQMALTDGHQTYFAEGVSSGPFLIKDTVKGPMILSFTRPFRGEWGALTTTHGLVVFHAKKRKWIPLKNQPDGSIPVSAERDIRGRWWVSQEEKGWSVYPAASGALRWEGVTAKSKLDFTLLTRGSITEVEGKKQGQWWLKHSVASFPTLGLPRLVWGGVSWLNQRTARFSFSLDGVQREEHLFFHYRLRGTKPWMEFTQQPHGVLPQLPYGLQEIEVEAYDRNTMQRVAQAIFPVEVHYPWWFNGYLWSGTAVVSVGLFLYFRRIQRKRLSEKRQWKAEREELERRALRLQMNPHFLFNALESISSFLVKKEPAEAVRYLNRFAKLMRFTLSSSQHPWISAEEERSALEHYISLEQLRFDSSFQVVWEMDAKVEISDVEMPPMVLQPLIENAILHGLRPKGKGGLLILRWMFVSEKLLAIEIEDNGVGMSSSASKASDDEKNHRSAATTILKARLNHLAQEYGPSIGLTLRNAPEGGTIARVVLPIQTVD